MKNRKRIAQFFLSVIAFSIATSMLPLLGAYADTKTSVDAKAVSSQTLKEFSASSSVKATGKSSFVEALKAADPVATSGSVPLTQTDVNKKINKLPEDSELGAPELKALKDIKNTDLCDRNSGATGGIGKHTYLEYLMFVMGDLKSPSFDDVADDRKTLDSMKVQPEAVPATDYDCFPEQWKTRYTAEQWKEYQKSMGYYLCGSLDFGCKIEKSVRIWVADAIKTGLTWIMNIATGSGSGGGFQACRVGSDQDVDVNSKDYRDDPNSAVDGGINSGFDAASADACSKELNEYYALSPQNSSDVNNYQKMAIGLRAEPKDANGNFDNSGGIGSGASSINNPATTNFFRKSANIGLIIAVGMIVGAVIQAMVQQKPQLLFRSILIQLPLFGIGILAVPILTRNFMAFIDGVSYYMADNSQRDIARIGNSIGVNVGNIAPEAAAGGTIALAGGGVLAATTPFGGPLIIAVMKGSFLLLLLIAIIFLIQVLGLWALMQFREASIVLVLAVIPLSLSASIWPQLTRTANKFIKLLASLIVAKVPIVMALSMGLNFIGDWAYNHTGNTAAATLAQSDSSGGSRALILGMAVFGLAFLAPTFVITLFDAIGEMGGSLARGMHTAVGQKALMYSSQAAGLKGLPGHLTGYSKMMTKKQSGGGGGGAKGALSGGGGGGAKGAFSGGGGGGGSEGGGFGDKLKKIGSKSGSKSRPGADDKSWRSVTDGGGKPFS